MLRFILLFNLILCPLVTSKRRQHKGATEGDDLGGNLISALRNDANLDLSVDEDYEDLRAELLAYHTALATLTNGRRSMKSTPCWQLGGICVDHKLCEGHRSLSEVPGCKSNLEVCCFTWNNYQVRDMRDKGIDVLAMPWSQQKEIGGKGVIDPHSSHEKKHKKLKHHDNKKHHDDPHHGKPHHENQHHDSPHQKYTYNEKLHHENRHHESPDHEYAYNENLHHNSPIHEYNIHEDRLKAHKKPHFMRPHKKKTLYENPPLLVIIRSNN